MPFFPKSQSISGIGPPTHCDTIFPVAARHAPAVGTLTRGPSPAREGDNTTHPILRAALLATPLILATHQAGAVWLQCQATGNADRGPIGFFATIVDVGAAPRNRLAVLQQRLAAYAGQYDPTLTGVTAQCFAADDPQIAASR